MIRLGLVRVFSVVIEHKFVELVLLPSIWSRELFTRPL